MKSLLKLTTLAFIIITLSACNQHKDNTEWSHIFDKYKITGTFILKNMSTNESRIYNVMRSDSAYLPASTFKVINSLIALQTSAVKGLNDTIKWDGINKGWEKWNNDHTLRTAMPSSCIWFYQELARRIGKEQMQYFVNKSDYGNKNIESDIDNFWLEGDLRISANEQIEFLEKLVNNTLPFNPEIQEMVKRMMITDTSDKYTIHSKTGLTDNIGWNIGYIETKNNTWIFALNLDIKQKQDATYRNNITYDILKFETIIE